MKFARDKVKALVEAPTYRLSDVKCVACAKEMDVATPVDGTRAPEPNDIAVCAYCGHLQAYDDDMMFRELTDTEVVECAGDSDILLAQAFARDFRAFKRRSTHDNR